MDRVRIRELRGEELGDHRQKPVKVRTDNYRRPKKDSEDFGVSVVVDSMEKWKHLLTQGD